MWWSSEIRKLFWVVSRLHDPTQTGAETRWTTTHGCERLTRGAYLAYAVWVAILQLRVEYSPYDVGCEVHSGDLPKVAGPLQKADPLEKCGVRT